MTIALKLPPAAGRRRWPALLTLAFALGLAAGLLLPSGRVARACSCLPPPPPAQALAEAAAVFDGSVARVEQVDPGAPYSDLWVELVVHTQWKGVTEGRVVVRTAGDSAMCGFPFQLGRRYLVYAEDRDGDGRLEAGLCSRSRLWDAAEAEALGPDEPPQAATPWPVWIEQPAPPGCPRCAAPPPPDQARDEAAAVFHGRLIGVEDLGPEQDRAHALIFQSRGWWKGSREAFVRVRLPWQVWFCQREGWEDIQAAEPEGYIVYAVEDAEDRLVLELCGRSRAWSQEEADALGPPEQPDPPTATPTPSPGNPTAAPPDPSATPEPCPSLECPPCAGPRPAEDWLAESDSVFHGRVTRIERLGCDHIVHFEVDEVWKGPSRRGLSVFVDDYAWQCSRSFPMGLETVVFARQDPDRGLVVPLCFGIVDGDARQELGPGQPVAPGAAPIGHLGGRIRVVAPVPGTDLAWIAQGARVWAASLAQGEGARRYGPGLLLPGQVEALAVDGARGVALTGRTLHLLDLSEADAPRATGQVSLVDLDGAIGPIGMMGGTAAIAHGDRLAMVALESGTIVNDGPVCGAGTMPVDLLLHGEILALSSLDGLPGGAAQASLAIFDLGAQGPIDPGDCWQPDWRIEDSAAGRLALAEVAGQMRLYSMAEGGIVAWDVDAPAAPVELARWPADWRPQGVDPRQGDIAVASGGEVYVSLHRWMGGFYTAGEVLQVLEQPDPRTGLGYRSVHQSLRPLDARLVAADGASGTGRLVMAGPEGLSRLEVGADSATTFPLVTDALDLALNLDDPGPVLYALSAKAGFNGFLLNQPDPAHPQPYTFLPGGAERDRMTVDEYRAVVANHGVTDIRDQKLEIVSLGGAMVPSRQGEIDLRDAGAGLVWAQDGVRLVVRRQGELVLYDLRDAAQPVERSRLAVEGQVADLSIAGDRIFVVHHDRAVPRPDEPVATRLSVLRIAGQGEDARLEREGAGAELPFAVYEPGLPRLAYDADRELLWLAGAIHCPGDPRYFLAGLSLADPAAPAAIAWGWEDLPEAPSDLLYADGHLFLAGERTRVMDVRNPRIPTWAGELAVDDARAVVVHDQTVYAAAGADGVFLFQPELAWDSDPDAPTPVPEITPSSLPPTPTPDCRPSATPTLFIDPGTHTPTPTPSRPGGIYLPWLSRE